MRCYSVEGQGQVRASNPLVQDGQKLIPSVTRVFSKSRDMYVYLQAYERGATTTQPLVAFVTFYRGTDQGVRNAAAAGDRGTEPQVEGGAAAVQHRAGQAASRASITAR